MLATAFVASVAAALGIPKGSLGNWVRQQRRGQLGGSASSASPAPVSAEQMEIARLCAGVGQIVGWSLKPHMQTSLIKEALTMAYRRRRPQPGLIWHSDRGSQYCSYEFQDILRTWQITASMSRKGDCWDNSPVESFWARLKLACLEASGFPSHRLANVAVMDWITFYNHRRLHSVLGYMSPMEYEKHWHAGQYEIAA